MFFARALRVPPIVPGTLTFIPSVIYLKKEVEILELTL